MSRAFSLSALVLVTVCVERAEAQDSTGQDGGGSASEHSFVPAPPNEPASDMDSARAFGESVTFGGYAEAFYQWNFNRPSNGITHFRGFDNRHNSFTIANVALSVGWDHEGVVGRATLQVGHTPSTYYLDEPELPGAPGTNPSGTDLWKFIQEAYVGYRFNIGEGLLMTGGLFLSAIGVESIAVHENWNWSRSNLFFGLPFYHAGVRASYPLPHGWRVTLAGYNGWNRVVDDNSEKSLAVEVAHSAHDEIEIGLLYFSGVERPAGAPEGRAWRHLFDAHVTWFALPRVDLRAQLDAGFEPNRFGTSAWIAGALYARVELASWVFFAARGDAFYERLAESLEGRAEPIFWPVPWVASATATLDFRPHDHLSFRLEYRYDHAAGAMFFGGRVPGDGITAPFVANRRRQDTMTAGVTGWF